jgi:hypothetical protein
MRRESTVAIADRAPRMRESPPTDRRVRFCRFGLAIDGSKRDELPMVFGFRFRPDFLHRFDGSRIRAEGLA